jgi:succinoglycan biosynthesis protein ExoM
MHMVERRNQRKARVGICIATFRRRELLRQLLLGISKLTFDRMPAPDILVVVVDNDPAGSAADICDAVALPCPARYLVEPRRGIAQARNRAIREAENPDFLAFLDDDEVPTPLWLDELLWTRACFEGDVVCGPVLPRFAPGVPEWVKTGRFFSKHMYVTGHPLETCCTGNVLISRKVIATVPAFDERFALTGGEDTHFFLRVRQAGFNIICSGGGVAYEDVPTSRASLRWLLRRAYQSGNSWVLCESSMDRRISTRLVRIAKACGRILQGAMSACLSPVFGKAAFAQALSNLFLGVGMIAALAGRNFQAYQSAGTDAGK